MLKPPSIDTSRNATHTSSCLPKEPAIRYGARSESHPYSRTHTTAKTLGTDELVPYSRTCQPLKPGNARGGKGPQFKIDAIRGEGPGDWATYQLRKCSETAEGVARESTARRKRRTTDMFGLQPPRHISALPDS